MLRRAGEDHHHSREDVAGYLETALQLLEAHLIDSATHDATLAAIVGLLASKQMVYEQMKPTVLGTLR